MGSQYYGDQSLKNNPSKASISLSRTHSTLSEYKKLRDERQESYMYKSESIRDISAIEKILAKRKTEIFGNLEGMDGEKLATTLPALVPPKGTDNAPWTRIWNTADRPNDKKEVAVLSQQLDHMLQEIGINPNEESHTGPDDNFSVSKIEQEQKIYDTILTEIIRQVYVECKDRGVLLGRASKRYRNLFYRVPTLLYQIQGEIDSLTDANNSLRALLEKLMKEKSSTESDLHAYITRLSQTESENSTIRTHLVESLSQARSLKEEKEEFVQDLRRLEENLLFQQNLHKQLLSKDQESQNTIKQLSNQLEDALARFQLMEANNK